MITRLKRLFGNSDLSDLSNDNNSANSKNSNSSSSANVTGQHFICNGCFKPLEPTRFTDLECEGRDFCPDCFEYAASQNNGESEQQENGKARELLQEPHAHHRHIKVPAPGLEDLTESQT